MMFLGGHGRPGGALGVARGARVRMAPDVRSRRSGVWNTPRSMTCGRASHRAPMGRVGRLWLAARVRA